MRAGCQGSVASTAHFVLRNRHRRCADYRSCGGMPALRPYARTRRSPLFQWFLLPCLFNRFGATANAAALPVQHRCTDHADLHARVAELTAPASKIPGAELVASPDHCGPMLNHLGTRAPARRELRVRKGHATNSINSLSSTIFTLRRVFPV